MIIHSQAAGLRGLIAEYNLYPGSWVIYEGAMISNIDREYARGRYASNEVALPWSEILVSCIVPECETLKFDLLLCRKKKKALNHVPRLNCASSNNRCHFITHRVIEHRQYKHEPLNGHIKRLKMAQQQQIKMETYGLLQKKILIRTRSPRSTR